LPQRGVDFGRVALESHCATSLPVVSDASGRIVAIGDPCSWPAGVATKLLNTEYTMAMQPVEAILATLSSPLASNPTPLRCGVCQDPGPVKASQEDAAVAHLSAEGPSVFCVFDGHGGAECATYAKDRLPRRLLSEIRQRVPRAPAHRPATNSHGDARQPAVADRLAAATSAAFRKLDGDFLRHAASAPHPVESGATAVVATVWDDTLIVANVGDARAVASRNGIAVPLTTNHTAANPNEAARLHRLSDRHGVEWRGLVEVTRALGDLDTCITSPDSTPPGATSPCKLAGLSAEPTLSTHVLGPDDEFLVLASDGVFDVMDDADVVRFVRARLEANDNNVDLAASRLVERAVELGSEDNLTAMIIAFKALPPPPPRPRLCLRRSVAAA